MSEKEKGTYWNEAGKYQKEYNQMWELVPSSGEVKIPDNPKLEEAIERERA